MTDGLDTLLTAPYVKIDSTTRSEQVAATGAPIPASRRAPVGCQAGRFMW
ncbi:MULTISPECIES: hypothetical protein [unclassified Streptomyces]